MLVCASHIFKIPYPRIVFKKVKIFFILRNKMPNSVIRHDTYYAKNDRLYSPAIIIINWTMIYIFYDSYNSKFQDQNYKNNSTDEGFIQSNYENYFITLLTVSDAAIIRIKCIGNAIFLMMQLPKLNLI